VDLTRTRVEPLGRQHDRSGFRCGTEALVRRLGAHLLLDALSRRLAHAGSIAAMAVVVDAKTADVARSRGDCGFACPQVRPNRRFMPIRLVAQLLG